MRMLGLENAVTAAAHEFHLVRLLYTYLTAGAVSLHSHAARGNEKKRKKLAFGCENPI